MYGLVDPNGKVDPEAFVRLEGDDGLSVDWLEFWAGTRSDQLSEVRKHIHRKLKKRDSLAVLSVGGAQTALANFPLGIDFVRAPLEAEGDFPANPAHCLSRGFPAVLHEDHLTAAAALSLVAILEPAVLI